MIRKAISGDFDFIYGLYMHPQSNPFLLYEQMNKTSFMPIFQELLDKKVLYVYENDNRAIGMCKLVPQQHRNAHIIYLGSVTILADHTGKGEGLKMMDDIKALVREKGYLRIELTVAIINQKAIRLYERAGFVKEGVLKNYTLLKKENKFLDELVMAYLF
ncbi:MAG TPA: GNAT family N-acetyltransferase [Chitinophagaceae bacterium]|nr:GNAT family N-acetyltransferase [Chitinophagaceae bacterium]